MNTILNVAATAPVSRRLRAYFAPVERTSGQPTIFDPAQFGRFDLDAPPKPWVDLGWCTSFSRRSESQITALKIGTPPTISNQVRTAINATVHMEFESWGKLQMALASGSQQMNLLQTIEAAAPNASGGMAAASIPFVVDSTLTSDTVLDIGQSATNFNAGDLVAVDVDYIGQLGYLGSGASATYVRSAADVGADLNYVRRVSLNVGRVVAIEGSTLRLADPLLAGIPTAEMQVSHVEGFVDREGGTFFHEWSGLFCCDGEQGDRVLYYYPRLQTAQESSEQMSSLSDSLTRTRLSGAFRALPIRDTSDGETVVCFRTYLPAPMRSV